MSKNSYLCEIDVKNKDSYSGMLTNGSQKSKTNHSEDLTSLNNTIQCSSDNTNKKSNWQMDLGIEFKK